MNKVNIIQFMPYFPPHKGGVETVGEEIGKYWIKKDFGEFINIVSDIGQDISTYTEKIIFENNQIGYKKDGYEVLLVPSFEIINNFPIFKFWTKDYRIIKKYLGEKTNNNPSQPFFNTKERSNWVIFTHTRFFLSSFFGGLFAKYHKIKWIHIEHGSDYVKLGSSFKSKIAYIYDRIIGRWIFKKAYKIVAISEACKNFIQKEFLNREVEVIYNGIDFCATKKVDNGDIIKIGFVGRLVKLKGVDLFLEVFKNLSSKFGSIELEIVGDGEERQSLETQVSILGIRDKTNFLGLQNREYIKNFLSKIDILVNPSFSEGLPTTVLEGLLSNCVIVATDVGGTKEISSEDDLIIVNPGNLESLQNGLEKAILNYKSFRGKSNEIVKEKFDWNKNIEKYFNLCKDLGKIKKI